MLQFFGIRHHGPGSARSLLRALEAIQPDCLLIEIPSDAEAMLSFIHDQKAKSQKLKAIRPPVSLLIYNPKDISQASYLPFAEFSPEWQAVKFVNQNQIPLRCIDLPIEIQFAIPISEKIKLRKEIEFSEKLSSEELDFRLDPIAQLAKIAGYTDSERWWEVTFESAENEIEIFNAILEMIKTLREASGNESTETLQREAWMRLCIRKALNDGFKNIAVVCGAWHLPALHHYSGYKVSQDKSLFKGINKIKTTATWIPWSYDRLTFQSGYGSGVISPAWYDLLFQNREEAAMYWMIKVAHLFREKGLDASSAHVIEAIRLSDTLAAMRNLVIPGIEELKEAAIATICTGDAEKLELIEKKLITGEAVGHVPRRLKIPSVPLLKDIEMLVKSARLTKYWENTSKKWLGATAAQARGGIDLREESGKMKSHLLHRLNLIDVPWGRLMELDRHQSAGSFKEFWMLSWSPLFTIQIIEKGAWGNTLEGACVNFIFDKSKELQSLPELTGLVANCLAADLTEVMDFLIIKLENIAAITTDVFKLMDTLPHLVKVMKYGDTRGTDIQAVSQVIRHLVPRICIGLPGAVIHLSEDASREAYQSLLNVHLALSLLNHKEYIEPWNNTLKDIAYSNHTNGILTGACLRLLFEKSLLTPEETATQMHYALSKATPPIAAAQWLEGFLHGSGLLLIHNNILWKLIDEWVNELDGGTFREVLPLLRRTFSRFPQPERERMLELAKRGQISVSVPGDEGFDEERARVVLPVVRGLLGIGNVVANHIRE